MTVASFEKFRHFLLGFARGEHHLADDDLFLYLSNTAPSVGSSQTKEDVPGITERNGYVEAPVDVVVSLDTDGNAVNVSFDEIGYTASGGNIGPFRYVVIYNDSHEDDVLICFADLGESITINNGDSVTFSFQNPVIQIR